MTKLRPLALKDAPALIETVFPAQKISFEAQRERKAGAGQTLTSLGSYWKGRKPLILVRAVLLGTILPRGEDSKRDLEIFEKLLAFDDHSLARRALANNGIKPNDVVRRVELSNLWDYFTFSGQTSLSAEDLISSVQGSVDLAERGISVRWRRDVNEIQKLAVIEKALGTYETYESKAILCKRPEEVDEAWLYEPIWRDVNSYYSEFGVRVTSFHELVEQFGILRYGHRPRVGDAFSGGGSIPFESARLGAEVAASDLNPIACMLTWGAINVIGAQPDEYEALRQVQRDVSESIETTIQEMGVEHDSKRNRAKAYLYCLETVCPETGWLIPMSWTWVISRTWNVVARLVPDREKKRFDIEIASGVSQEEMDAADVGTVRDGTLVYEIDGKTYRTPVKTLRGDRLNAHGASENSLRRWTKSDVAPAQADIYQERLFCIQWIKHETLDGRRETFFAAPTDEDLSVEKKITSLVCERLAEWQEKGLVPDMEIEVGGPPRYQGRDLIVARGWSYWHHLFNPRQILLFAIAKEKMMEAGHPALMLGLSSGLSWSSRLCSWDSSDRGREGPKNVFTNQALNTIYNYGCRSFASLEKFLFPDYSLSSIPLRKATIEAHPASEALEFCEYWITDPPYADAVMYHEITEFFIAWLRRNSPEEFRDWTWDSRRALAIRGSGDVFRRGMVDAYRAMAEHMPDNGMQCVMFTHQDTSVWSDMVGIFWAAGLQVVAAWYIATETTSELKKGGYVQGTVILMLRKRPAGERSGFKQRILPAVRTEVKRQIESMMHLNEEVKDKVGEPVFNDSDLQMAGYAAALKVLTAYTHIGGDDVTSFALRPRQRGEETVVDEIVQQAAEAANSLLVPEGLEAETWSRLTGIQRFYFRMMDMETTGASKLDNYQNFAKAFRVADYGKVMRNMAANSAGLKRVTEFISRDLTDSTEIGPTWLGRLIIGLQQLLAEVEPPVVVSQIQEDLPDFLEVRPLLINLLSFIERKAPEQKVRDAAEILGGRLKNLRAFSQ
ncbi:DUF1156 domain-containing protein [Rhizobium leguminosarum bv. viciae]|uniref:anti-phage-associated DUF1156 domain-containing protein n=1 Tax=Rhizobium leguminosarum TaxID=384 RepID=UPI00103D4CD4|nr:anti-phage-associated DUF1156 domain-containing protein [Rhizobium leguminosarum]TCA43560.1 DUF1156 domain-containing protein [Rhizobium leguminosarum bv. viciae]